MQDRVDRLGPTLLKSPTSDRLWLFYLCFNYLCYVTRSPGSAVFSNEVKVHDITSGTATEQVEAGFTMNKTLPVLHLMWKDQLRKVVFYSYSTDNALTWARPHAFPLPDMQAFKADKMYALKTTPEGPNPTEVYITYPDKSIHKMLLRRSTTHGATWSLPQIIQDSGFYLQYPLLATCANHANLMPVLEYPGDEVPCEFGIFDLATQSYKSSVPPSRDQQLLSAALDCVQTSKTDTFIIVAALFDETLKFLRLRYR